MIRARGLVKRFGSFTAVDGIDFELHRGEAFGFLGPNGAGKSSTMRMIGCVSPPSAGELSILGLDPVKDGREIRARLGVVPQDDTLDVELTVRENLLVYGRYFGLPRDVIRERTARLLEFVQLSDRADDQVDPLSGGMKRRLTIARSLINEPDILLLDEPTTGLDPQARHAVWDRLFRLKQQGVTLVLTTHYMDEAEQLCDRLVVMDAGKIAAGGTPRELIERYSTPEVLELRFDPADHQQSAEKLANVPAQRLEVLADRVLLYVDDGDSALLAARQLRFWLTNYRRTWRGSIYSSVLNPVLFLGSIGLGLGTLVNAHAGARLGGVSYLAFLAPGLLAAAAMETAVGESTYPVYGSVKWNKVYQAAVASPLRPVDIFHGHVLFVTLRLAMNCSIFLAVAAAFGAIRSPWMIAALPVAVLTGLAFATPIEAWAVTRTRDTSFTMIFRFFMIPLFLFSGTFFPITQLPSWLQPIAYLTPLWHGVSLCRALNLGTADLGQVLIDVGYLAALAAAGLLAGNRSYRRRLYV